MAVAPVGKPVALSATALLKSLFTDPTLTLKVAVPPLVVVCVGGVVVTVKSGAAIPAPVKAAVCGEPVALSATETEAVRLATELGVNVTEIVHDAPVASVSPQVLVSAKSIALVPVIEMPEMFSTALPVFDSFSVCAVVVAPITVLPKLSVVGASVAAGAGGIVPEPLKAAVCGDPVALSATETVAAKLAAELGVNVTEIVQDAPAASVAPQVLVSAKSLGFVPPIVMPEMFSTALPVFDSVSGCALVVTPVATLPKLSVVGESVAVGAAAAVPVPWSVIVDGLAFALLATLIEPVCALAAVGVNVTVNVQVSPGLYPPSVSCSQVPPVTLKGPVAVKVRLLKLR
jgi:hypothetical protein